MAIPMVVGLMCGREFSFPPAFIHAVKRDEPVRVTGTSAASSRLARRASSVECTVVPPRASSSSFDAL